MLHIVSIWNYILHILRQNETSLIFHWNCLEGIQMTEEVKSRLRKKQLEILEYMDQFCDKNHIVYSLAYGSALGGIRHKGFIPWDDDIDIFMDRANYEKLKRMYQNEKEKYFLQCIEFDAAYNLPFCKIRDSETTFIEDSSKGIHMNQGIFIDLFIWDYVPDNAVYRMWQKVLVQLYWILARNGVYSDSLKGIASNLVYNLFKKKRIRMIEKINTQLVMLNKHKSKYITETNYGLAYYEKYKMDKELLSKVVSIEFEGKTFKLVSNYDRYLTRVYGNYMMPPPANQRIEMHTYNILDFDKSYTYYMQ